MSLRSQLLTLSPCRPGPATITVGAVVLLAAASASLGCGGIHGRQFYSPVAPKTALHGPMKTSARTIEFDLGAAKIVASSVDISKRLLAVAGPAVIIPIFGKNDYVTGPLEVNLRVYVRDSAVVGFDPRMAMVRLRDGRELAPESVFSGVRQKEGAKGFEQLPAGWTAVTLRYGVPVARLGPFTLHLPGISVDGRTVQVPPITFRSKTSTYSS